MHNDTMNILLEIELIEFCMFPCYSDGMSEAAASRTLLAILLRTTWTQYITGGILRIFVIISDFTTPILLQ